MMNKKKRLRGLLFDMDGVLFDSMPLHAKCWVEAAGKYGLRATERDVYRNEGRTGASTVNLFAREQWGREATEREVQDFYAEKCRLFNLCEEAPCMPGAAELLGKARSAGLRLAVVTGSGQDSLLERLGRNYPGVFAPEWVVSSRDCERGKPHPDPYLLGLKRTGLKPDEAVVVENAPLGVQAAVAAGIYTVAVNTGPLPDEVLLAEGADRLYPSMQAFSDDWEHFLSDICGSDGTGWFAD